MSKRLLGLILMFGLVACSSSAVSPETPSPKDVELQMILTDYRGWIRANPDPFVIPDWLVGMCDAPSASEAAQLSSPHSDYYSNVYVNKVGSASLAQEGQRLFPAGSILVKEKLLEADDEVAVGIGIMIKHDEGYNPAGGNWEYAYWNGEGAIQQGAEQVDHCQACHIGVSLGPEMAGAEYYQWLQQLDKSGPTREMRDSVFTTLWIEQIP